MSTDYDSNTIVGVPMKNLYRAEVKEVEREKFDQDTGKPYKVKARRLYGWFGNKELPTVLVKKGMAIHDFSFLEDVKLIDQNDDEEDESEESEIGVHLPSCEETEDHLYVANEGIVGIVVCRGDTDESDSCSLDEIMQAHAKVKLVLSRYGYTGDVMVFSQLQYG